MLSESSDSIVLFDEEDGQAVQPFQAVPPNRLTQIEVTRLLIQHDLVRREIRTNRLIPRGPHSKIVARFKQQKDESPEMEAIWEAFLELKQKNAELRKPAIQPELTSYSGMFILDAAIEDSESESKRARLGKEEEAEEDGPDEYDVNDSFIDDQSGAEDLPVAEHHFIELQNEQLRKEVATLRAQLSRDAQSRCLKPQPEKE